jgi:hypothetical protein
MIEVLDYLGDCRTFYEHKLKASFGMPLGCSEKDIAGYELSEGVRLPKAYRQFLTWMGKDYSGVFKGSEWFLKDVKENTMCLPELLEDNGVSEQLSGKPLCFFSHQGYISAWFDVSVSEDDPMCFLFSESSSDNQIERVGRFSQFLLGQLNDADSSA